LEGALSLELRSITKRFPGILANDAVDLSIDPGEIVAVLGENGAGKTTLMNVAYGLYGADEGSILVDGEPLAPASTTAAIAAGIGMVHQHFMLVPVFTVAENIILGDEPTGAAGWIERKQASDRVRTISEKYNLAVDPDATVEDLPVGVQQRVEIIKVINRKARYLIFDEPTAVLTPQEVEEFFHIVRGLREDGKGVVFISHKLDEALEIADRIVVMRQGRKVAEVLPGETSEEGLAELMVGRPVELVVHKGTATPGTTVLEVRDLVVVDDRSHRACDGVSFTVRAGEIVGIAGVNGNGQSELVDAITGMRLPMAGSVLVNGEDVTAAPPREMHKASVAHVPEDRQESGLVLAFSVAENLVLDSYYDPPYSKGLFMDWSKVNETAAQLVKQYDVRTAGISVPVGTLSGGNQQKVIIAREFHRPAILVLAAQPTRGVDVGSIEYIHSQIVAKRDKGAAVLVVSTELDEVLALADRILVMYEGRIAGEFSPTDDITDIGLAMLGGGQ
jgi:simple sugar transport system ATP-binding protein